ncbi:hypothetical protein HNV11_10345 [Spirosoma taeanense]|uniref:Uncharacterized protein n=1 Tax=Spirosoma taeanense TaxID=2735870 RepID=A0A6M5YE61_9BACT|nr:hypothetical protein HNV11_10345 [Spirosoma taeanense]
MKVFLVSIGLLTASFSTGRAQSTATQTDTLSLIVGKWTGSFDGAASGNFELVLNQDSNRKLSGQVIMIADDGTRHPIDLKTVAWQNGQLNAAYTDPQDGGEVTFSGKYVSPALKGTWKSDGGQSAGTWQVARATR